MPKLFLNPIGIIRTPHKEPKGTPIQPPAAKGAKGTIEVFEEFVDGLKDLDGFSHITLLFHFHLSPGPLLQVAPFMDTAVHGVFATRAPRRPNPIGLSTVRLAGIDRNILHIEEVDIVDGSPLLDIKPYVPRFDLRDNVRTGWLAARVERLDTTRDDGRFAQ
ncbi:MAG: tRNA (N6-threonylcarbamoyladenosine(37)-N6)-methyltransferase TrmO [Chitinivibrionales bacterium]|nr:tRNA (N6-threonylcarbamoyladenosine(37)-N6)-methyltransferase TrmO [Chitinivibrionales bacterium]MBD3396308.1 tRNA (N6-threonylcarbamoyladenosine(37)-N6)-methyltransferase TrmO [Chitinivibrionales bacterium]